MYTLLVLSLLARAADTAEAPSAPTDTSPAPIPWKVDEAHGPTHPVKLDLREGTWMSVDASGDRLVFDLLGDLWAMPRAGGEATRLTSGASWDAQPRFSPDGAKIAFVSDRDGNEQLWVMDADGQNARRVTDEREARITEPMWDPTGAWLFGRRRTVDTRSIGVTELWQYHLEGGKGFALTSKDAHPHAGEADTDGRYVWFSSRSGRFEYNHDPMSGLWSIWRLDRRTGEQLPVVQGAGSASRPVLSPDGEELAFVSRDRSRTQLEIVELASGDRRVVVPELDRDEMEAFALHGTYPQIAWTDAGIVLWAKGKLWNVQPDGTQAEIPFHAVGEWAFRDVTRAAQTVPDEVRAKVIRWPTWNAQGAVAFSALGALWVRSPDGALERISEGTGYAPAWSPDGARLAWTSWSDQEGGRLHVTTFKKGRRSDEVLPIEGQLVNPAWSTDGAQLVALRGVAGSSPDLSSTPWYELTLLSQDKKGWTSKVVTTLGTRGVARAPRLYLRDGRVWFMEDRYGEPRTPSQTVLVSVTTDGLDKRTHLVLGGAEEVVISPDFTRVAYKDKHQAYVTALPMWGGGEVTVGDAVPSNRLTQVVGDWLAWTPDSAAVTWAEGPTLKKKPLQGVGMSTYDVPPPGDKDWDLGVERVELDLRVPRARPSGVKAYTHARVVTMKGDEVLEDATIVVDGDRIVSVTPKGAAPDGAEVVDCTGKTVIPGLIDVHAHLHYTAGDVLPEQEWRYEVALDYGVTTVHDPSASTDLVFTQAERVEAGFEAGPRVYSTGYVLYGALSNDGAETPDKDAAKHHIERLKDVGAFSVKVYQQSQRERRQWYAESCYEAEVLCVPEGGGDLFMNLGMIQDGYSAIEHALPQSPVYADVRGWFAGSRTGGGWGAAYTPTLLVAYGGLSGEEWYFQNMNPIDDPRLRRHFPARELDAQTWRRGVLAQDAEWNFRNVARDAAKLSREGVLVTLGAHGQLQGLGVHWELWGLASPGAMTPHEALRSATLHGAIYLGLDQELGSIEAGKLADFVVLDANPLDDVHHSDDIAFTVKNGAIWR